MNLSLEKGIELISKSNNVPEWWSKKHIRFMVEYQQKGSPCGNTVEGYRKWMLTQRKSLK